MDEDVDAESPVNLVAIAVENRNNDKWSSKRNTNDTLWGHFKHIIIYVCSRLRG